MSVLEKIVQAEKDAQALLAKTREDNAILLTNINENLAALRSKNAQDLAKQSNEIMRQADQEIKVIAAEFDTKKDAITVRIAKNSADNKNKIVEQIVKDLTR